MILATNPLRSLLRRAQIHHLLIQDLREADLTRCKTVSWDPDTRPITKFIWRVGTPTITMPTIDMTIEQQSRG